MRPEKVTGAKMVQTFSVNMPNKQTEFENYLKIILDIVYFWARYNVFVGRKYWRNIVRVHWTMETTMNASRVKVHHSWLALDRFACRTLMLLLHHITDDDDNFVALKRALPHGPGKLSRIRDGATDIFYKTRLSRQLACYYYISCI